MKDPGAHQAAERAARDSYGRLLAILSARTHDIAASEDALADAFARALERWPADGIPARPDAWLLSVARHRKLDAWRHTRVQDEATQALMLLAGEVDDIDSANDGAVVPDERLRLLFVCAHPAIDAPARAPLMLQTVLGLDAARMAGAFLTSPSTLGQRLVRAKARIRAAGIPFEYPQARELPQRLQDVLDGIYAAYGTGWDDVDGADAIPRNLTAEAIDLARILCKLMPREPEPLGLLALMLFCEARTAARRNDAGAYVPLDQQDITRWNHELLAEAEHHLRQASSMQSLGAYQLEAAIQSAHCERRAGAPVPPETLVSLYQGLLALRPSIGAQVSLACALANARGPETGLQALDAIPAADVTNYQPFWAARAHLLAAGGARAAARQAYDRAIGLSTSAVVRAYLNAMSQRL
ncbi:RNA polymerase sigma factor [Variovorax sp. PMC12]|nr:RNA polymerase subunit sigma-70 [Variovorax sp. PMC12]QRY34471.1 RNA polymerase subunit sigma-70 [Variovorax sp. PDNC026]